MNRPISRLARGWRAKLPALFVVVAVVAAVVAAITGAANPVNVVQFVPPGHWTYNVETQTAFHVAGATADVDASVPVDGDQGSSQVVQGDTSGYVVGSSRITEFGESSLEVVGSKEPPAGETPVGIEVAGGPYLVYRDAGKVVRLGENPVTIEAGAWLGVPVASKDGTLWLPRTGHGLICQLPAGVDRVTCPVAVPRHHRGALSLVNDRPMFVDTSSDELYPIQPDGLGAARKIGVDIPDQASVASSDVSGRVAILDSDRHEMDLVDAAEKEPNAPVKVDLDDGDYDGPVSTGQSVVVMDRDTGTLSTFDSDGQRRDRKKLPKEPGDPRLSRGEDDRVYADGAEGDHVLVVDRDGAVDSVPIGEDDKDADKDKPGRGDDGRDGPGPGRGDEDGKGPQDPNDQDEAEEPEKPDERETDEPPPVPGTVPGAPPGVTAAPGDGVVTVNWDAAADNRSPITNYTVSWAGGSAEFAADARTATIRGLVNGTRYTFTVSATNAAGTGPGASSGPVTPGAVATPATAPPGLNVLYDAENNSALVTWNQPNLNGGTLVNYVAGVTGERAQTVSGTSALWAGLPGGVLTFTVSAVTRTPDGQTLNGAVAAKQAGDAGPTVTLSRGDDFQDDDTNCDEPDCAYLDVQMSGFEPDTDYHIFAESDDSGQFADITVTTDENGDVSSTDDMWFDGADETVTVTVETDDGDVTSNDLYWEPQ